MGCCGEGRNKCCIYRFKQHIACWNTQGIITWIYEANANYSDLELITSMDGLMTSEEKVRHGIQLKLLLENSGSMMKERKEIVALVEGQHTHKC